METLTKMFMYEGMFTQIPVTANHFLFRCEKAEIPQNFLKYFYNNGRIQQIYNWTEK